MKRLMRTLFVAAAAATALPVASLAQPPTLTIQETDDGRRCIVNDRGDASFQLGCRPSDGTIRPGLGYQSLMLSGIWLAPEPARILVIGLRGGTLPDALAITEPQATIHVVEADPGVIERARQIGFQPSDRMRLIEAPPRDYVAAARDAGHRYDLVLVDAIRRDYLPRSLRSREWYEQLRGIMSDDGALVVHSWLTSPRASDEGATLEAAFGARFELAAGDHRILATRVADGLPSDDEVRRHALDRAGAWLVELNINPNDLLRRAERTHGTQPGATVIQEGILGRIRTLGQQLTAAVTNHPVVASLAIPIAALVLGLLAAAILALRRA